MIEQHSHSTEAFSPTFSPARIVHVDVGNVIPRLSSIELATGRSYRRILCFVRLHEQPIGAVEIALQDGSISPADLAREIWNRLSAPINEHLREDGIVPISGLGEGGIPSDGRPRCVEDRDRLLGDPPLVSVVVATRNRPDNLARCLYSLRDLQYPRYEIVVVDNAPSDQAAAILLASLARQNSIVRYVREDTPGLSAARNRGLSEARGEIVAFTDDDVVVDSHWLQYIVSAFHRADNVACVTGNILPAEMETPSQAWIEQFGGFGKGPRRRIYHIADHRAHEPLFPYAAGRFGSGGNLAFRRKILQAIGGFDPSLGTGTPARGGEDLAAFVDVITRGHRIVYEPSAIVSHYHRREYRALQKQVFGYGIGLAAYLTRCAVNDPWQAFEIMRRVPSGIALVFDNKSVKNERKAVDYPAELTRFELLGMICGPFAYFQSRWQGRLRERS